MFRAIFIKLLLFLAIAKPFSAFADFRREEPVLFVGGAPTADTLEFLEVNVSSRGGLFLGLSDSVMIGGNWKYTGGHLRVSIFRRGSVHTSVELYTGEAGEGENQDFEQVRVYRSGSQIAFNILHRGKFTRNLFWNGHYGVTKGDEIRVTRLESPQTTTSYEDFYYPNYSLGLNYNFLPWMMLQSSVGVGNTLYLAEFIPPKAYMTVSSYMAPLPEKWGKWLAAFRLHVDFMYLYFSTTEELAAEGFHLGASWQYSF